MKDTGEVGKGNFVNIFKFVAGFHVCVVSQLHMLKIPGLIPTAHPIVGSGGTVQSPCYWEQGYGMVRGV